MSRSRSRLSRHLFGILVFIIAHQPDLLYPRPGPQQRVRIKRKGNGCGTAAAKPPAVAPRNNPNPSRWSAARQQSEVTSWPRFPPQSRRQCWRERFPPPNRPTQPTIAAKSKPISLSKTPLVDGKAKLDAGDLLGGSPKFSTPPSSTAIFLNPMHRKPRRCSTRSSQSVIFSPKIFADDEFGGTYTVQPGELLTKIAMAHQVTWQYLCHVNNLSATPKDCEPTRRSRSSRAHSTRLVEKGKFNMEIWIGGEPYSSGAMYVTSFPVGLGRDDSTPTGKWMIQPGNKIKNPTYYSPRGRERHRSQRSQKSARPILAGFSGRRWPRRRQNELRHPRHDRPRFHRQAGIDGLHPHAKRRRRPGV